MLQDAAQSFHCNNAQVTLHSFVCYFNNIGELQYVNVVLISDCMKLEAVTVHLFQKKLANFLKIKQHLYKEEVICFSYEAVSHYKNVEKFTNLCYHINNFRMLAEWLFFPASHEEDLVMTYEKLAARASLQPPHNNQIMTLRKVFDNGNKNTSGINFLDTSVDE